MLSQSSFHPHQLELLVSVCWERRMVLKIIIHSHFHLNTDMAIIIENYLTITDSDIPIEKKKTNKLTGAMIANASTLSEA